MNNKTARRDRSRHRGMKRAPLAVAMAVALGATPLGALAATIAVTSGGDDPGSASTCTLRQAIVSMNTGSVTGTGCSNSGAAFGTGDTITFDTAIFPTDGSGTITLSGSRLSVTAIDLTIDATANNNVTLDANLQSGVLIDSAASGASLTVAHLTLSNGKASAEDLDCAARGAGICSASADLILDHSTISGNSAQFGGGIYTDSANITLTHSTVSDNTGKFGGGLNSQSGTITLSESIVTRNAAPTGFGAGIRAVHGTVSVTDSTLSDNSSQLGGGIYSLYGSISLTNCTVSGNSASHGAGMFALYGNVTLAFSSINGNTTDTGGGVYSEYGDVTLTSTTVSGNSASLRGGGIDTIYANVTLVNSTFSGNSANNVGGGLCTYAGAVTLTNTTFSNNVANLHGNGIYTYDGGASVTLWNSIVAGNSGGGNDIDGGATPGGDHNLIGNVANLDLGPLADNGGPTLTLLPQAGSAAIDAGDLAHCPATDQRGVARPQAGVCDIGAVEVIDPDEIFVNGFE